MVLIDMEMPKRCGDCALYSLNSAGNGMYYHYCRWLQETIYDEESVKDGCPLKPFTPPEPQITTNIYDQEEIHHGCTVQILSNSVTGE